MAAYPYKDSIDLKITRLAYLSERREKSKKSSRRRQAELGTLLNSGTRALETGFSVGTSEC